jgi:hypothetical protein
MVPFIVWFLTCLWSAETLVSVCHVHNAVVFYGPVFGALVPALLVRRWLAHYRLKRVQRAAAWQSPPLPPPLPQERPPPDPVIVFPLLNLRTPFTRNELVTAFRRRSMELHPDHGGNAALFRMLLAERKRALGEYR